MSLTSRISLTGPPADEAEDYFSSALGVIFTDDVTNQHGDSEHGLLYSSPHLPRPLHISLCDPVGAEDRRLFSHYLWNSSLLLAELIEAGTLGLPYQTPPLPSGSGGGDADATPSLALPPSSFSVTSLSTVELGSGTALPSLLCALLGASRVLVTDYPAPPVLENLRANIIRNTRPEYSPLGRVLPAGSLAVAGHQWGSFPRQGIREDASEREKGDSEGEMLADRDRGAFDRVLAADCLWMPWQHERLRRSVAWLLREGTASRAWVVAGFHTGREKMRGFFEAGALARVGLEVERIWERDCDGRDRPWAWDRGVEEVGERKRWLVVAVLRRTGDGTIVAAVEETADDEE